MQWSQTLVLIILAIIGVVVFVILLVELINIPKPLIAPFADGTKIKIKSLANNLYLRPISCNSVVNCPDQLINLNCQTVPSQDIVSAIGQADDPLTTWQLCQYSALSDEGEAKYLIYSQNNQNTFVMGLFDSLLVLRQVPDICTVAKTKDIVCNSNIDTYFSFILNEKSANANTTSGSYNIVSVCYPTGNNYVVTSGQGAVVLPSPPNTCPPVITTQLDQNFGCSEPFGDPRCTLSYLFVIEVQS